MRRKALHLITTALILLIMGMLIIGAHASPILSCEPPPPPPPGELTSNLIAGQHYDAGDVEIWVDDGNLHVEVSVEDGWTLGETHLYVGAQPPTKAAPGRFPYANSDHYVIPLEGLDPICEVPIYIAFHAVVCKDGQEETAWADEYGIPFGKGWAMYLEFPICNP